MLDEEIKFKPIGRGYCEDCKNYTPDRYRVDYQTWKQFGEFIQPDGWKSSDVCDDCLDKYFQG